MSMGGHDTKWRRKIAENFNRLSRAHERYRQTERKFTFAKNVCYFFYSCRVFYIFTFLFFNVLITKERCTNV